MTIYTSDLLWADPDLNQAAEWMRLLATNADLRSAIGAAGKRAVEYRFDQHRTSGEMVERLWHIIEARDRRKHTRVSDTEGGPVESTDGFDS